MQSVKYKTESTDERCYAEHTEWVPGTPRDWLLKRKLSSHSGSVALRVEPHP